ncbi:MAG: hypothetical protein JSV96_04190 [Candidatus Aminicenantes bacterium]|nr:MAG: hypothetical protein JSV96_04190 [Candidatus Aminicenantes bacterium]
MFIGNGCEDNVVDPIREKIKRKWRNAYKDVAEKLDEDYAKLVFDTIESKNRSSVLYAMHLFDLLERDKLTPEIKRVISQKAGEVTATSLGDLLSAEGATWFPEIDDDITQENFVNDIREVISSDAYQQVMRLYLEEIMEKSERSEIGKMEMAKVIGFMDRDAPLVKKLEALISDDSPEVSCCAIKSAARLKKFEHIPAIVHKLGNPETHEEAVSALKAYGHSAVHTLEEYLRDNKKDIKLRKAVVKVLAIIGSQKEIRVLLGELGRKTEELETEIIDALDRIRSEKADIRFPAEMAKKVTLSIIKKYCQTFIDLQNLESHKKNEEIRHRMETNLETHFMNIFKLLGLYYPKEDVVTAFQNLKTGNKDSIDYAIEHLDITLKKDMKDIILPLIEDLAPSNRQRKFQKILRNLSPV